MASTHLYDLVVKTGEYTNSQGETKARYKNIGKVMRNDKGQFMILDKTFNPAGVPGDSDSVMVSMFEPRARDGNQGRQSQGNQSNDGYGAGGQPGGGIDDDEIPFAPEWRI